MKFRLALSITLSVFICSAFIKRKSEFIVPKGWPEPKYDFNSNPYDADKVAMGRKLFYDPILSIDNSISCASCHSPFNAFAHTDHALSHGLHDSIGKRNAPGLFNLAWQERFMWDGAIHHLDMQPLAPLSNPNEMGENLSNILDKLNASSAYKEYSLKAFHDSVITSQHFLQAIAQFMLSLTSSESRYDSVMRKQASFTPQEQQGYFIYKANCDNCHKEPLFTTGGFERNGLPPNPKLQDEGRSIITNNKNDSLKFKVPSLRNLEYTAPYMHDGRFKRLQDVISYYTSIQGHSELLSRNDHQRPIKMGEKEKIDLMAFLLTLSDRKFVLNKEHWDPQLELKSTLDTNKLK